MNKKSFLNDFIEHIKQNKNKNKKYQALYNWYNEDNLDDIIVDGDVWWY